MPASAKNVDWPRVLRRVAAGESPSAIAKEMPVTRQAIENRWKRHCAQHLDATKDVADVAPVAWLPIVEASYGTPIGDKDSPQRRAEILQAISEGVPKTTAARSAGISDDTLRRWTEREPVFAAQIGQAQTQWQARAVKNWAAWVERDWRAGQALLQSHPDSRVAWGPAKGDGGASIQIVLNIADPKPLDVSKVLNSAIIDEG
jgi:hypothetical protein